MTIKLALRLKLYKKYILYMKFRKKKYTKSLGHL